MTTRSSPARPASAGTRIAQWLAGAALAWGALAFGAVYPWTYWALAVVCGTSGLAGLIGGRGIYLSSSGRRLVFAMALIPVATSLQLIPWPIEILSTLSPAGHEMLEQLDVRVALQLVNRHALSLDPTATLRAVLLFVAFGLFMFGMVRSFSQGGSRRFIYFVSWLGIGLALIAIIQKTVYKGEIYGLWRPLTSNTPFGPFVNRNHFAGWMAMAIPLVLGFFCAALSHHQSAGRRTFRDHLIWCSSREASQAVQAAFAVVLMGFSLALTLSRSGMLSLAAALILCGYAGIRRQRGALARSVIVGGLTVSCILVVFWAGADAVAARFAAENTEALGGRIPIWHGAMRMLHDFWLTGSGLNTYGVATLFYPAAIAGRHVAEAHNDYLQLAVEGGLLVGVPILAAVSVLALSIHRRLKSAQGSDYWIRLGAVAGIVAIAVQSTVEFSLQIPGNAALFSVLCALALHRGGSRASMSSSVSERSVDIADESDKSSPQQRLAVPVPAALPMRRWRVLCSEGSVGDSRADDATLLPGMT